MTRDELTRRCKIIHADEQLLVELLNAMTKRESLCLPVMGEIPEGTEVLRVGANFNRRCLDIMVCHESFAPVDDGDVAPEIESLYLELRHFRRVQLPYYAAEEVVGIVQEPLEAFDCVCVDQSTGRLRKSQQQRAVLGTIDPPITRACPNLNREMRSYRLQKQAESGRGPWDEHDRDILKMMQDAARNVVDPPKPADFDCAKYQISEEAVSGELCVKMANAAYNQDCNRLERECQSLIQQGFRAEDLRVFETKDGHRFVSLASDDAPPIVEQEQEHVVNCEIKNGEFVALEDSKPVDHKSAESEFFFGDNK